MDSYDDEKRDELQKRGLLSKPEPHETKQIATRVALIVGFAAVVVAVVVGML